jgi:ABC-type glycerol-3-phosphate transport system permease component
LRAGQTAASPYSSLRRVWAGRRIRTVALYLATTALALLFVLPFLWLLSSSVKPMPELQRIPPTLLPQTIRWQNFTDAWRAQPFDSYFRNTIEYTGLAIAGTLLSCTLVAYGFARLEFPGRNLLFILVLSTLMLPGQVTLIPQYILFRQLGWLNTLLPLVVPIYFGNAFYIFLFRQFFLTLPRELDEAAVMDGANPFDVYVRIILPLSRPIVVTVAAFTFISYWNDFFGPLIYLNRPQQMTLAVGLLFFKSDTDTLVHLLLAASLITLLPIIIIFLLAQRYFVRSVVMSGLKEG